MTSDSSNRPAGPSGSPGAPRATGAATMITVAPTGAELAKSAVPALPVTLEELVTTAKECREEGAAIIHVHIRDASAQPTLDVSRLKDTVHALRESTDLIVQLSTGGAVTDPFEHRLAVLDAAPDGCSLTCGTVNFGDDVFMNPWPFMCELYVRTQELGVVPEFELFDLGHIATLHRLLREFGPPAGQQVKGGDLAGKQRRIPESDVKHVGAQPQPGADHGCRGQHGERSSRAEMVGRRKDVKAEFVRARDQPRELFPGRRAVAIDSKLDVRHDPIVVARRPRRHIVRCERNGQDLQENDARAGTTGELAGLPARAEPGKPAGPV